MALGKTLSTMSMMVTRISRWPFSDCNQMGIVCGFQSLLAQYTYICLVHSTDWHIFRYFRWPTFPYAYSVFPPHWVPCFINVTQTQHTHAYAHIVSNHCRYDRDFLLDVLWCLSDHTNFSFIYSFLSNTVLMGCMSISSQFAQISAFSSVPPNTVWFGWSQSVYSIVAVSATHKSICSICTG